MKTLLSYSIDELCNENKAIILRTQKGVEIIIEATSAGTVVTVPFGNKLKPPQSVGILSKGFLAVPVVIYEPLQT